MAELEQTEQVQEHVKQIQKKILCHSCSTRTFVSDDASNYTMKSGVVLSFCNDQEKHSFLSKHKLN